MDGNWQLTVIKTSHQLLFQCVAVFLSEFNSDIKSSVCLSLHMCVQMRSKLWHFQPQCEQSLSLIKQQLTKELLLTIVTFCAKITNVRASFTVLFKHFGHTYHAYDYIEQQVYHVVEWVITTQFYNLVSITATFLGDCSLILLISLLLLLFLLLLFSQHLWTFSEVIPNCNWVRCGE